MIKILFSIFFISVIAGKLSAQNLVPNGSFEDKAYCPSNFNQQQMKVVTGWSQVGDGTPDYFHTCSDKVGVPKNIFGEQAAQEGEGYVGLATYSPGQRNYREYLQAKLTRPLVAGEMVCIEMYISQADYSKYVTDAIGANLSKTRLTQHRAQVIILNPSMANPRLNMLDETSSWMLISDIYIATGGEEFITLGNFQPDRDLKIIRRTREMGANENNNWSYIYIDNISVKPVKKKEECSCENDILASLAVDPPLELSEYDNVKLDAILFDFDQDILTDTALAQMDEIYTLLRRNRAMYMEIDGHTDSIGDEDYNDGLSQRRANRAIEFLEKKGIDKSRLTMKSFGSTVPAATNSTDGGRAKNRRVEFQIREKKYELIQ
ncbi:MAG: OmpA family protein [Crocinitomicaceae bacterium]|nr:OmpA family protein [Crocinitomicaceae bacterium]